MANNSGKSKEMEFDKALTGRNIPVLTLDNKWYRLLDEVGRENVKPLENKLNEILKAQGRVNSQIKDIKKIKKKLMADIVAFADENSDMDRNEAAKKMAENKRLLEDCNKKLDEFQEQLVDFPFQIDEVNKQLMLLTMEHCYETMQDNTDEIEQLDEWVTQVRIELKKNLIRKQEKEAKNHEIYSYMHDIFGPEVVNMFDLRYNPEEHHPLTKSELEQKKAEEATGNSAGNAADNADK